MIVKTSEIIIENISKDIFLTNWNKQNSDSIYEDFFNKFNLKVPFKFKASSVNIVLKSKLVLEENNKDILIKLYSNITKPLVFSLAIAVLSSLISIIFYYNIIFLIFIPILLSFIFFATFYWNTLKKSEKYLKKIKENYI